MPTLVSTGQFTIVDVNDSPITNLTPPSELTSVVASPMGGWTLYSGTVSNSSIVNDQVGPNGEYPRILRIAGNATTPGWYSGYKYWFNVDTTKAYIHYCWIRRRSATSGNLYIGWTNSANYIDNLSGTNDSNPYFISSHNPTIHDKWYLCVGVIWPAGYGAGDTGLAGMYDPHTGVRVYDGAEWRHNVAATQQYIRFGFYNTTTAQATTDGYDFLPVGTYCMDGTHPTKEAIMNTVPAAMTAALSKEVFVFPATSTGSVSSYVGSGTQIRVYQGTAELTYDGTGTSKGTWRVNSTTPTNITVGTISDSGTFATVADHSGVADATDTSTIVYNIVGKTLNGADFTLLKTQTFSKSKTGTNGIRTATLDMYKWATSTPTTFPSGTSTYTWSTNTFTTPGTTNSWTLVPGTPSAGQNLYQIRQVYTDILTSTTSDVVWSADASNIRVVSYAGTNGTNGTSPLIYDIITSSPVIVKDAPDAATSGTYSSITIQGKKYDGNTTTNYGWVTVTANGATEATSATDTASSAYTLSPASTAGTSSYTVKLYNQAAVSGATLLDTQTITVVFKGTAGSNGTSAIAAVVSNEAHVFPADNSGNVTSYIGSGTLIRLYEGATELVHDGTGTQAGKWKVTAAGTNITPGAISTTGNYATVAVHSGVAAGTDTSSITYTITGTTSTGQTINTTKTQTFSKSKSGSNGTNGTSAIQLTVTNEAATITAYVGGALAESAGNVSGTATLVQGGSVLSSGVTYSISSSSGATATINNSTGAYSLSTLTNNTGTFTVQATYNSLTYTKIVTVSKLFVGYEVLSSDPTGTEGRIYYNSGTQKLRLYTSGSWTDKTGVSGTVNVIADVVNAGSITAAQLATTELITLSAQIKDSVITNAKITSLDAGKISAGTVSVGVSVGDNKVKLDGANRQITIRDTNNVVRVKIGDLSV